MRKFYLTFPKSETLSHQLTWSHYFELLKCDDSLEMQFYMKECINQGESANAIKIQIWVTLIANLLLMVMQKRIKRTWSFSGFATMYRIMLMYYVNPYSFFEAPEKDWLKIVEETEVSPPEPTLFD